MDPKKRKSIIRGAVTDGFAWTFILLKLNQLGGGVYMLSDYVYIGNPLSKFERALIPGILAHWVGESHTKSGQTSLNYHQMIHSHEELGADDYFELEDSVT